MKNTGEQFVPGLSSKRLQEEHFFRYDFVKKYCENKVVLDMACGTGYGTNEIAKVANYVIGVDISKDSIRFAKDNYKNGNLDFIESDCSEIFFPKEKFDVVISFETIEHLNENKRFKYLNLIKNSLKKNGIFILSTPNKLITSPFTKQPLNKFHILEFTKKALNREIEKLFFIDEWYGQRFIINIFTKKIIRNFIRFIEVLFRIDFGLYTVRTSAKVLEWNNGNTQPRIMILVAKNI